MTLDPQSVLETAVDSAVEDTPVSGPQPVVPLVLRAGQKVGRYLVLDRIGEGAVGVVFAAYDPELDRKIAVKLLRPKGDVNVEMSTRRTRLMREAQALARLSHPNVVAVHDVGTFEGRVYVAMEFIEGETLRDWGRAQKAPVTREKILELYAQAGRGLAAAHAAGLVHRDFKPENVLVGDDGRVRVLDFGLARAADGSRGSGPHRAGSTPQDGQGDSNGDDSGSLEATFGTTSGALSLDLTRTGGVMGTPAYMSPEQHLGLEATPRSDQFSFCVALYESLYRSRPYSAKRRAGLAEQVSAGEISDPPAGTSVPGWIRSIVVRGLQPDPGDRHPDMESLLAALERDPSVARTRIVRWGIAGLAVAGLIGVAAARELGAQEVCPRPVGALEQTWSAAKGRELDEAFAATNLPFADFAAASMTERLDAWGERWLDEHERTCTDTRVHKTHSEAMYERRVACLERARARVDALVQRLVDADAAAVEGVVSASDSLPDPSQCGEPSRLAGGGDLLTGPSAQEAKAIAAALDEAEADMRLSHHQEAWAAIESLAPRVESLGHAATGLRFHQIAAGIKGQAGEDPQAQDHLRAAYFFAERGGDDRARIEVALDLIETAGYDLADYDTAQIWTSQVEALIDRLGEDAPAQARAMLAVQVGTVLTRKGELDEAIERLRSGVDGIESGTSRYWLAKQRLSVALREKNLLDEAADIQQTFYEHILEEAGPDHPSTALALGSLGNTEYARGNFAGAVERFEESLAILERSFGKKNPRYYDRLNNYAAAKLSLGEIDEAELIHREVLARKEEQLGPKAIGITPSLENLGNVLIAQNRHEEAKTMLERSLAIKKEVHGPDHPSTVMSEMNLGVALYQLGEIDRPRELYEHTREVWTQSLGPEHPDLGLVYSNLGDVEEAAGKHGIAVEHQLRALGLFEAAWGEQNPDLGYPLTGLGISRLALGDVPGAVEALERAHRLREGQSLPDGERGRMDFALARALDRDRDREETAAVKARVIALASAALEDSRPSHPALAAKIEHFLAARQ